MGFFCNIHNYDYQLKLLLIILGIFSEIVIRFTICYILQIGSCDVDLRILPEVKHAAELIGLPGLALYCNNVLNNETYLNGEITTKFQRDQMHETRELLINKVNYEYKTYLTFNLRLLGI